MNKQPILIAGPPRVGSTMLAGLFFHHGIWIGEAKVTKHPSTNSMIGTENVHIKSYLKTLMPGHKNWTLPIPDVNSAVNFEQRIESLVETEGMWLVKTGGLLLTWQLWREAFPKAIWIFPKRSIEKIVDSVKRHPVMGNRPRKQITAFISEILARQDYVSSQVENQLCLDMNCFVNDPDVTRFVVSRTGLECKEEIVKEWIKKEMWHE